MNKIIKKNNKMSKSIKKLNLKCSKCRNKASSFFHAKPYCNTHFPRKEKVPRYKMKGVIKWH